MTAAASNNGSLAADAARDVLGRPDPSVWHLLLPKIQSALARRRPEQRSSAWRGILLVFLGLLFWSFIFGVLERLLRYFKGVPEIGELLAGKLLGLILVGFFSLLVLSNVITALSTFFLARDLDLLVKEGRQRRDH